MPWNIYMKQGFDIGMSTITDIMVFCVCSWLNMSSNIVVPNIKLFANCFDTRACHFSQSAIKFQFMTINNFSASLNNMKHAFFSQEMTLYHKP